MTEWIVDTIEEAFDQKIFAAYKEIFDLFTRVFVQSKQVSVPMDILRMALYGRITSGQLSSMPKKESETHESKVILKKLEEKPEVETPKTEIITEETEAFESRKESES